MDPRSNTIEKPRLVAALLAELDASLATVLAEDPKSGSVAHGVIQCDLKTPFIDTEVSFEFNQGGVSTLKCVCCFGGQRICFDLERIEGHRWKLPKSVSMVDLRNSARVAFANRMYSAELVSERGSLYGYAVDVNRDCLAIDVEAAHELRLGDTAKVVVRLINTNCDVFYNGCTVAQIKPGQDQGSRIILRLAQPEQGGVNQRRHIRRAAKAASIRLKGSPFSDAVDDVSLEIRNVSSGGMTVGLTESELAGQMMPGLILKGHEPDLSYLVVWVGDEGMGIRPLLADSHQLGRWYRYLDLVAPPNDRKTSITRKELAGLLTKSGLVKGTRRGKFGRQIDDHVVSQQHIESPVLTQRHLIVVPETKQLIHIHNRRICDSGWLLGDITSVNETSGYFDEAMNHSISSLKSMAAQHVSTPRYLGCVWHASLKPTDGFFKNLASTESVDFFDAVQLSIKGQEDLVAESLGQIQAVSKMSSSARRELSLNFSPNVFEFFVGLDGSHPIVNIELMRHGPYHKTLTKVVFSKEEVIVAHRIITHSIWSTTGVANSVFVLVPKNASPEFLKDGLSSLAKDEIAYGTDDFLIIFDGGVGDCESYLPAMQVPRKFLFLVHDLLLNNSLSFQDHERRSSRRRAGGSNGD